MYAYVYRRDKNPFLSSFIKLATVSDRQTPPIHARPRLNNWRANIQSGLTHKSGVKTGRVA